MRYKVVSSMYMNILSAESQCYLRGEYRDSMSTSKKSILEEGENFMRMPIMHNFLDWKSFFYSGLFWLSDFDKH